MHSRFTVVYDACVLYPARLRNVLMELATTGLFRARWSDEIHDEWIRNLLAKRPDLTADQLNATRACMNEAVLDCLVTGYEGMADHLSLPDEGDRHVVAAAIRCHAALIITKNTKDFPDDVLSPLGIQAEHPDQFVSDLLDLEPGMVVDSMRNVRARLRNPVLSAEDFLASLAKEGLLQTYARLSQYAGSI